MRRVHDLQLILLSFGVLCFNRHWYRLYYCHALFAVFDLVLHDNSLLSLPS